MSESGRLEGEEDLAVLLAQLADLDAVADVTAHLAELLVAEVPELDADPAIRSDLERATAALAAALAATSSDEPFLDVAVPEDVLDLVRTMARRRVDVTVVLRGIRVGHRLAWREVIRVLDARVGDPELRYAALTLGWDRIAAAIEAVAEAAVAAHTAEREAWLSGAHARRTETISALIAGAAVDPGEATTTLGYRILRRHLACVIWLDESGPGRGDAEVLSGVAGTLRQHLAAREVLVHPDGARSMAAWFGIDGRTQAAFDGVPLPPGVRLAVGLPGVGPSGFARSHAEAIAARRVADRRVGHPAVTLFDEVELICPFLDRPEEAATLVRRELGDLARDDATAARLRETALAYLRAGASARDAAALLGTHKNTVLYRLRHIEEALGRPVLERRLKLEIALSLVEELGPSLLATTDGLDEPHNDADGVGRTGLA